MRTTPASGILWAMTLAVRNTLFAAGIAVASALLAAFAVFGYMIAFGGLEPPVSMISETQQWLFISWRVPAQSALNALIAVGVAGVVGLLAAVVSARIFRRVSSQEIYFLTVFFLTLTLEVLRLGQLLLPIYSLSNYYGMVITRVLLVGRLFGGLALFSAGIYNAGAEYPRVGTVSALLLMLSLLIVYLVPVDQQQLQATLVHLSGADGGIGALLLFLGLGAIVNYAIGWIKGYHERGGAVLVSVSMMVTGTVLIHYVPSLFAGMIASVLILSGATLFILLNRAYHLWY